MDKIDRKLVEFNKKMEDLNQLAIIHSMIDKLNVGEKDKEKLFKKIFDLLR